MIKKQFSKFIVIGVLSTIVNYGVFYVLYEFLSSHYMVASTIGFISGVFAGFSFNKNWTFEATDEETKKYIIKYFLVYIVSLLIGLASLRLFVEIFGILPEVANILMIGITTCTNFIGTKFWVFKK